jgi:hypothetical protein
MWFPDGSESHASRRAGFRPYNGLSRLDLFYAVDRAIHIVCLDTEMVQAIAILLVRVFQDGQLHVAVGQVNGLSSFWRWTRLPEAKNFLVEARKLLGVVRADRYVPDLRHVGVLPGKNLVRSP